MTLMIILIILFLIVAWFLLPAIARQIIQIIFCLALTILIVYGIIKLFKTVGVLEAIKIILMIAVFIAFAIIMLHLPYFLANVFW